MEISYEGNIAHISAYVDTRQQNWIARIILTGTGEVRDFVHGDWESRRGHTNVNRTMLWDIRLAEGDIYQCKGLGQHPDIYRKNSDGYWVVQDSKLEMCDDIPVKVIEARRAHIAHLDTLLPLVSVQQTSGGTSIAVTRSYPVRAELKARGYRFGNWVTTFQEAMKMVDKKPPSGWRLVCTTDEMLAAELLWLESKGWVVSGINLLPESTHPLIDVYSKER